MCVRTLASPGAGLLKVGPWKAGLGWTGLGGRSPNYPITGGWLGAGLAVLVSFPGCNT